MSDKVCIILARHARMQTVRKIDKIYYITPKIRKKTPLASAIIVAGG